MDNGRCYLITFEKSESALQRSFLSESLFEILDIDPGLFEDPDQCSFFQFAMKGNRKDTPFFLHDNVA
jgi:hypothetical protein